MEEQLQPVPPELAFKTLSPAEIFGQSPAPAPQQQCVPQRRRSLVVLDLSQGPQEPEPAMQQTEAAAATAEELPATLAVPAAAAPPRQQQQQRTASSAQFVQAVHTTKDHAVLRAEAKTDDDILDLFCLWASQGCDAAPGADFNVLTGAQQGRIKGLKGLQPSSSPSRPPAAAFHDVSAHTASPAPAAAALAAPPAAAAVLELAAVQMFQCHNGPVLLDLRSPAATDSMQNQVFPPCQHNNYQQPLQQLQQASPWAGASQQLHPKSSSQQQHRQPDSLAYTVEQSRPNSTSQHQHWQPESLAYTAAGSAGTQSQPAQASSALLPASRAVITAGGAATACASVPVAPAPAARHLRAALPAEELHAGAFVPLYPLGDAAASQPAITRTQSPILIHAAQPADSAGLLLSPGAGTGSDTYIWVMSPSAPTTAPGGDMRAQIPPYQDAYILSPHKSVQQPTSEAAMASGPSNSSDGCMLLEPTAEESDDVCRWFDSCGPAATSMPSAGFTPLQAAGALWESAAYAATAYPTSRDAAGPASAADVAAALTAALSVQASDQEQEPHAAAMQTFGQSARDHQLLGGCQSLQEQQAAAVQQQLYLQHQQQQLAMQYVAGYQVLYAFADHGGMLSQQQSPQFGTLMLPAAPSITPPWDALPATPGWYDSSSLPFGHFQQQLSSGLSFASQAMQVDIPGQLQAQGSWVPAAATQDAAAAAGAYGSMSGVRGGCFNVYAAPYSNSWQPTQQQEQHSTPIIGSRSRGAKAKAKGKASKHSSKAKSSVSTAATPQKLRAHACKAGAAPVEAAGPPFDAAAAAAAHATAATPAAKVTHGSISNGRPQRRAAQLGLQRIHRACRHDPLDEFVWKQSMALSEHSHMMQQAGRAATLPAGGASPPAVNNNAGQGSPSATTGVASASAAGRGYRVSDHAAANNSGVNGVLDLLAVQQPMMLAGAAAARETAGTNQQHVLAAWAAAAAVGADSKSWLQAAAPALQQASPTSKPASTPAAAAPHSSAAQPATTASSAAPLDGCSRSILSHAFGRCQAALAAVPGTRPSPSAAPAMPGTLPSPSAALTMPAVPAAVSAAVVPDAQPASAAAAGAGQDAAWPPEAASPPAAVRRSERRRHDGSMNMPAGAAPGGQACPAAAPSSATQATLPASGAEVVDGGSRAAGPARKCARLQAGV